MTIEDRIKSLRREAETKRNSALSCLSEGKPRWAQQNMDEATGCDLAADFLQRLAESEEDQ